jgi:hypothetical protein
MNGSKILIGIIKVIFQSLPIAFLWVGWDSGELISHILLVVFPRLWVLVYARDRRQEGMALSIIYTVYLIYTVSYIT